MNIFVAQQLSISVSSGHLFSLDDTIGKLPTVRVLLMSADPLPDDSNSVDIDLSIDLDIDAGLSKQRKVVDGTIESTLDRLDAEGNRVRESAPPTHVSGHVSGHLTVASSTPDLSKAVIAKSAAHATVHAVSVAATTMNHAPTTNALKITRRQRPGIYRIGSAALGGLSVGTIVGAAVGGPVGAIVGAATVAGVSAVSTLNSKLNS
ncbi:hypothetical protein [cf. Phormidesmis sp. LEGE 11477]|uniref:hypothetical protein n=1 Tax=cf. Phormidesmis sp. LEGE 11477 TaxID=1828680 RepID=UPI00187EA297|nr:hypothetical protein [cf. Phormidesmis sp. LEGE 11477]MBE9061226.1 hypothetical protein [cf. Phormidesmis sp. LEGE 11477]